MSWNRHLIVPGSSKLNKVWVLLLNGSFTWDSTCLGENEKGEVQKFGIFICVIFWRAGIIEKVSGGHEGKRRTAIIQIITIFWNKEGFPEACGYMRSNLLMAAVTEIYGVAALKIEFLYLSFLLTIVWWDAMHSCTAWRSANYVC